MTTVSIIGAGPAGAYAAELLAKAGYAVHLYEEHDEVGKPVACTGIVTKVLWDLIDKKKEFMVNECNAVEVIAPNNSSVTIPLREFIIDRHKFDTHLVNRACDAGAVLHTQHRFVSADNNTVTFRHKGDVVQKKTDVLIGADGPTSQVAKNAGLYGVREFWVGLQVTLKGTWNPQVFRTWFGGVCPGFFAWAVPENNSVARVGLAAQKQAKAHFDQFISKLGGEVVDHQPGPIPIYTGAELVEKGSTFLVGDAGGLVKATTGGGIISGMLSSKILAESIVSGENYTSALRPLKRELWLHKIIRNTLNRFSEQDYNWLIVYMNTPAVKDILKHHPREYPSRFLFKLLLKQPKFVTFAPQAITALFGF